MKEPNDRDQRLETERAYNALCALNEELDKQLNDDEVDSLEALLERRAAAIDTLVRLHELAPLPESLRRNLMSDERERQEGVALLKKQCGRELRQLHRQLRASSAYAKEDIHQH